MTCYYQNRSQDSSLLSTQIVFHCQHFEPSPLQRLINNAGLNRHIPSSPPNPHHTRRRPPPLRRPRAPPPSSAAHDRSPPPCQAGRRRRRRARRPIPAPRDRPRRRQRRLRRRQPAVPPVHEPGGPRAQLHGLRLRRPRGRRHGALVEGARAGPHVARVPLCPRRRRLRPAAAEPARPRRARQAGVASPAGAHLDGGGEQHARLVGDRRPERAVGGGVRQVPGQVHGVGHGRPRHVPLLLLPVRRDPPRHDRAAGAQHDVLLPVRQGRRRAQPPHPARRAARRVRRRRRPGPDGVDGVHAGARRRRGLRHAAAPRRPVVRRHAAAAVGLVRAAGAAIGEGAAVDGDAGQPRDRDAARGRARALRRLQRAVADAARGERLGIQPLLLLRRGRRRGARRHAGILRGVRRGVGAVPVAGGRPSARRPATHAVAAGAAPRAMVQHQPGAPGRGRAHAPRHGAPALRRKRRRRLLRPRPRLRALYEDLRQRGRQPGPDVHHHWRRGQQGRPCSQLGQGPQVGTPVGVPGGELRARQAEDHQRHQRRLDVAPQRRRVRHRPRRSGWRAWPPLQNQA